MEPQIPPAQQEQRNVEQHRQHTDRQCRDQGVDHLPETGDAAGGDLRGDEEPVHGQRENDGAEGDDCVGFDFFFHTVAFQ